MPTFTIADEDLEDLVRRDTWQTIRREGTRPGAALAIAVVLAPLLPLAAAAAFGMALAWGISLLEIVRRIRPWYASHHGSNAGPLTVDFREDGVYSTMPIGEGIVRWDQLDSIKKYPACFVFEFDGDEILVLPKRCFTSEELILLDSKAKEVGERRQARENRAKGVEQAV